ncbi:uncharacterized protein LOC130284272 isoform X2 [Hyla sarda]|nr:uncharacterized protein LOC130284272 isoform X2 [Hyla sarda]
MDALTAMYYVAFVLPIILITALCISCRRKIPIHIPETGCYDDKPQYTRPSTSTQTFCLIKNNQSLPRSSSSPAPMCHQVGLLSIPKSPVCESRRSSVGRENNAYPEACDPIPYSPCAPILKRMSVNDEDYDDEGEDKARGYIVVLPDDGTTTLGPEVVVTFEGDNRASLSSVGTDENYVNVGDSDDAKASSTDGNYVNIGDASDTTGGSLEYVNVEEAKTHPSSINQESEDDDLHEYENVEKGP